MLRARRAPAQALAESAFAPIYESSLWAESAKLGLGATGLLVWEQLALLALASADHTAEASQRYIAARLNDRVPHRTVSEKLRALEQLGVVSLDKQSGLRTIHALTTEGLAAIERMRRRGELSDAEAAASPARRSTPQPANSSPSWQHRLGTDA